MSSINMRIKKLVNYFGNGNNSRFAELIGVNEANIRSYINKTEPKFNVIQKIAEEFEINYEWLLFGKEPMLKDKEATSEAEAQQMYKLSTDRSIDIQKIPLYNMEATAGLVNLFDQLEGVETDEYLSIPNLPKCDGALYVTGDSMYPLMKSGDIVAYKKIHDKENDIFWGEMYLVAVEMSGDYYTTIKFIQKSDLGSKYIKLVSHNQHHQPKDVLLDKVSALALIKATVRIHSMQ